GRRPVRHAHHGHGDPTADPRRPAGPLRHRALHVVWASLVLSCLLFPGLPVGGLGGYDDAFYASEGKHMLQSHDWLTVRYNGHRNCEYPPLFIWLEALSMKLFGISDFAAKLPAAVCGLGVVLLVFGIARGLTQSFWMPIVAMWVMALSYDFLKVATHAMTDVPFTFFFTLAVYFFVSAGERPGRLFWSGVSVAAGLLTRSILGFLPLGIFAVFLVLTRPVAKRFLALFGVCVLVALGIPASWYLLGPGRPCLTEHVTFLQHLSVHHGEGLGRLAGQLRQLLGAMLFYATGLLGRYLPWWPFLLAGLLAQSRAVWRARDRFATLLVLWVGFVFGLMSFSEARFFRYLLPAFPAFAILTAVAIERRVERWRPRTILWTYAFFGLAALVSSVLPSPWNRAEDMRKLAPLATRASDPSDRIVFYTGIPIRYDLGSELLWYGDRLIEYVTDFQTVAKRLRDHPRGVVLMDRGSYLRLGVGRMPAVRVLGQSRNFVCFDGNRDPSAPEGQVGRRGVVTSARDGAGLPAVSRQRKVGGEPQNDLRCAETRADAGSEDAPALNRQCLCRTRPHGVGQRDRFLSVDCLEEKAGPNSRRNPMSGRDIQDPLTGSGFRVKPRLVGVRFRVQHGERHEGEA
ncbi:MAG TPA: glycosyltransferase family 39 protein, partial [Thermoanaerobaculia bacterium]|nr:glycosyltransferase family 39 protein [Thermoanaerobaculia bacterium]